MIRDELLKYGAVAALFGGGLRIISLFIPYRSGSVGLELFYGAIDLALLIGLVTIYLSQAQRLGRVGLGAFIVALAALASIVGPDAPFNGVDLYRVGAFVLTVSLALLAIQLVRAQLMPVAAICWLLTLGAGLAAGVSGSMLVSAIAGGLFGAGFICAGWHLLARGRQI